MLFQVTAHDAIDACALIELLQIFQFTAQEVVDELGGRFLKVDINARDVLTDGDVAGSDGQFANASPCDHQQVAFFDNRCCARPNTALAHIASELANPACGEVGAGDPRGVALPIAGNIGLGSSAIDNAKAQGTKGR